MARNIKKEIKKQKRVSFTNKDFKSFRNELQRYALTHFNENIIDFSDASLGGLILDMGAYVGDVLSYYIDHQFNENSIENAIEPVNLERLIREAGVKIPAATPAYSEVTLQIIVPANTVLGVIEPNRTYLPIIERNSAFTTPEGIDFTLLDNVDFAELDQAGKLIANVRIGNQSGSKPTNFILTRKAAVSSAVIKTETFSIPDVFTRFRTITLAQDNVNEIISVIDAQGDEYFEVDALTQDTVFKVNANSRYDTDVVSSRIELMHAHKRFISTRSINTGKTTIRFGSGDETAFDEDIVPDPSEHAIRLFGDRSSIPTVTIDPNNFLTTQTLGISPRNTVLTVNYRHGGGLSHNVGAGEIESIKTLITKFSGSTPSSVISKIRASARVNNPRNATGGEDEPSLEELRNIAIFNRSSQNRIVTREDLIARVYSLPSNFGRVFRVGVSDNPVSPRGALLHIISRDRNRKLTISSDTLKLNLQKYLNEFRLVSDSVDILDAAIINIGVRYVITVEDGYRQEVVLKGINSRLASYFATVKMQINKPIIIGEIENLVLNTLGVVSIVSLSFPSFTALNSKTGNVYSTHTFNAKTKIDRGYIFPPDGGIFEVKFPSDDIKGKVI